MFDFGNANDGQRKAISAAEGPVLITAGPGTGKTYTLVQRTIYLIEECNVKPESIFVATFTEKAAKELITRITNELSNRGIAANINEMYIGTFHSLCLRILKEHLEYTRLRRNYRLLDAFDQQYMVFQNIHRFRSIPQIEIALPNGGAWKQAAAVCNYVNNLSEELVTPEELMADADQSIAALGRMLKEYRDILAEGNLMDFSSIQIEAYHLLRENAEILDELRSQITHLMVDEYQDTNFIQEQLVFLLAGDRKNICVVGDDDQGLYRFRGATIRNILEFPQKFADGECRIIPLVVNYRSNSDIVDFYNRWMATTDGAKFKFSWDNFRYTKQIEPHEKTLLHSPAVVKLASDNDPDEWHEKILNFINDLKDSGKLTDYNQIAFLFQSVKHPRVTALARFLEQNHINVYSPRSDMFFQRDEIRLALGCLMLMFPRYNYTGTPYVKNQLLPEVVYAYGLRESIWNGFLKDADPIGYENVKSEEFLTTVVTTFWERYGGRIYDGLNPKLAIYAAGVEEAVTEVKPALERILAKLGVPASKILLNVGDAKYTKNDDIRDFNNLDVPGTEGNEKQFIILVEKGKEGWNCRSLFGVALFRSPKSKIFVLQATMRCLRAITDERLTATVFLSKENFDTLDDELHKNFNMEIKDIKKPSNDNRHKYQVRVLPPPRTITLKRIWHEYTLHKKEYSQPVDFKLAGADLSKYASTMYERDSLARDTTVKEKNIDYLQENMKYSEYSLAGEVARYLNISCILAAKILRESVDGADVILDAVNRYNAVLDDYIIPGVFHALFDITAELKTEDKELVLLREPKEAGYYEFSAKDDLVITNRYPGFTPEQIKKSFHADTYCFDSIPEKECFMQYITSGKVKEVYFTGMFTSNQGDLSVHYYDPESGRIRQYYPDFLAKMADGSYQLIEVKGDNKIDDTVVKAKQAAAEEMAIASGIKYLMYAGSQIVNSHVLEDASDTASTISMC